MNTILNGLKWAASNRYVQLAAVAVLLFWGGYGYGRFVQPAKVVTQEKVITVTQEKVVYRDRIVERIVKVKDKNTTTHTETTVVKRPDGTEETKTVVDTRTETKTNTDTSKDSSKDVVADKKDTTETDKKVVVQARQMNWRVGVGAGISIPTLLGQPELGVPGLKGAVIQAEVDRRIAGPFYLGLFGNTQGTVGLSVSGIF